MTATMKAEQVGTTRWRVLAIPFGGPFKGRDFDGEFFSPRTDVKSAWFKERPVIFHHGQDDEIGDAELGVQGELKQEADGWWAEMWLNRSSRYWSQVDQLLRAGKMFGSSGALAHLVRKDHKTGEILVWPHIEQTLTPTPANPFARVTASKAFTAFDNAGIELEATLRSVLSDLTDLADDLRADLPNGGKGLRPDLHDGGEAAATRRLAELEAAVAELRRSI